MKKKKKKKIKTKKKEEEIQEQHYQHNNNENNNNNNNNDNDVAKYKHNNNENNNNNNNNDNDVAKYKLFASILSLCPYLHCPGVVLLQENFIISKQKLIWEKRNILIVMTGYIRILSRRTP